MDDTHKLHLHLISDATGETLNTMARATTAQFSHAHVVKHPWNMIRSRFQLRSVLHGIESEPGPVLSTLVDQGMRAELVDACQRMNLPLVNVLDPVLTMLENYIGEKAEGKPGQQHVMGSDYFKRIDAMHYVLAHDDGQAHTNLAEADVILIGVSRSSKTPTCFYLANRGIKAANVPLVPGAPEVPGLFTAKCPVIGLKLEEQALIEIRRHRLRLLGTGGASGFVKQGGSDYVDEDAVRQELLWAARLCTKHGWPMIDVTRRSIEETAVTVLQMMDAWKRRRGKIAASP